jgi:CDP-6-deoxy-D-xylo-4-hexulose-3-dehydrase
MSYPLALSSWGEEEIAALHKVIETGHFTMGENVSQFENEFAIHFGSKHAVMVNSGSSANLLMIAALFFRKTNPLRPGDEVIVPAVSWSTTYYPLIQYGLKVKFVDIDEHTLNFDLHALEKAISDKTRVIMAVNLLGNPNDFQIIKDLIADKNIELIEDNCESMGASFQGKAAGSWGLMGTFSFFFSHHISTMEGGMILTNDEELYHIMLSLRSHGWTRHLPEINKLTGKKSLDTFEESYRFVIPGYNLRPLELSGAVGRVQLKKFSHFLEMRRSNANYFVEKFQNISWLQIQKEIGESSWFGFSIVLKNQSIKRQTVLEKLANKNIETRPIVAGNFLRNPVIQYFNTEVKPEDMVNAEHIHENGFFIGNHHIDMKSEIDNLFKVFQQIN